MTAGAGHRWPADPVRVAALDCGTNSLRLLIAEFDLVTGSVRDLDRRMEIVRLGQGVDRTGRLSEAALARTFAAIDGYAGLIAERDVAAVRMVATSATRDAANAADFVAGVHERLGVAPDVVTGAEEAALSFHGATADLPTVAGEVRIGDPLLVVDIGGGSTEFVLGARDRRGGVEPVRQSVSVDVGCVRITERCLPDDPPGPAQIAAATSVVDEALERVDAVVPLERAGVMIGLAGTVTTLAGIHLGLPAYDPCRIHHSWLPAEAVRTLSTWLLHATHAQRAALPVMHAGRVDVIGAGALVLDRILRRTGLPGLLVSEHDILDGIARSALARLAP